MDVEVLGTVLPQMGILVVKDAPDPVSMRRKNAVPGLLGMNIISGCYSVLFREHGNNLFSSPLVQQAGKEWVRALSECQQLQHLLQTGCVGEAVALPGPAIRIPAGSLKFVQATCNQGPGPALDKVMLEPLPYGKGHLPVNLLISSALLEVSRGTVNIPIVNVGEEDQWLKSRTVLGSLHLADLHASSYSVHVEEQFEDPDRQVVFVQSMSVQSGTPPPPLAGLNELKWPDLPPDDVQAAKTLLTKYRDAFSLEEGELGCTNLIHHDIPVMDEAPVRQRYRRLPPSQFSLVKAHIQDLLHRGIVRVSCSPLTPSLHCGSPEEMWGHTAVCRLPTTQRQDKKGRLPSATHRGSHWMPLQVPNGSRHSTWQAVITKYPWQRKTKRRQLSVPHLASSSSTECRLDFATHQAPSND